MLISTIIAVLLVGAGAYLLGPKDSDLKDTLQGCEKLQEMLSEHIAVLEEQQEILKRERVYLKNIGLK